MRSVVLVAIPDPELVLVHRIFLVKNGTERALFPTGCCEARTTLIEQSE